MERSMKGLLIAITLVLSIIVIIVSFDFIDSVFFEGFWAYLRFKPRGMDTNYWISLKPEYIKYGKYISWIIIALSAIFLFSFIGGVLYFIRWKIKIKRFEIQDKNK